MRYKARAAHPPRRDDISLTEALGQVDHGRMCPPVRLNSSGRFLERPDIAHNNVCYAVVQGEKIRARGDLSAFPANQDFSVLTPTALPSWAHVAQTASLLSSSRRPIRPGRGGGIGRLEDTSALAWRGSPGRCDTGAPDGRRYGF